MYTVEGLRQRIRVARGEEPADLVLRNARLVNVCSGECYPADIAIAGGRIAGISEPRGDYCGQQERDLEGRWLAPGLMDGHMHIESTMLVLSEFARLVVPRGVTAVMLDPHEFANVSGVAGIRFVLETARGLPLDAFVLLSSCVPASQYETPYRPLLASDLLPLLSEERVLGLAEMMNMPGVLNGDEEVLAKIAATLNHGLVVDGHAPGLQGRDLCAYASAGISSDHECTTVAEARERLRLGMWLMIREGSAARNLEALLPLIQELHPPRAFFVTDDRDPLDLLERGHIDSMVRRAIELGLDPVEAIRLASYNTAQYFRLSDRGAIVPGALADLVVLDDLRTFQVESVYKSGQLVAQGGRLLIEPEAGQLQDLSNTIRIAALREEDLRITGRPGPVAVIGIEPGQIVTRHLQLEASLHDGEIVADPERDLLKLVVIERHHASGRIGLGLVQGLGLKRGALASSVAHDAHNLVIAGVSDHDILKAAQALAAMGGGFALVVDGELRASVPLPLAGLVSAAPISELVARLRALDEAAATLGCTLEHPCMTLSFLSLSVIPALKLTDQGLIDVERFARVPLQS
ncbi:adenine deaminase [Thermogemmatispora tikiterensis]|uniref:Adenine deaminase n=1 Tax=Thermogemmatispora tikiterensis TaxID=1825093 RepID=A0A328VIK3_9CHLR|nr:adenine deaminase [Thermogemmatispora tikiterensis]RAQ95610.1 adenine deaminase [Thermogemmatispora tikiterensis]